MKNIILEALPTYLMVLLVAITFGLTFSVGLISNYYIALILFYLVGSVTIIFSFVVVIKYLKEVKKH